MPEHETTDHYKSHAVYFTIEDLAEILDVPVDKLMVNHVDTAPNKPEMAVRVNLRQGF
jgi:hypothetical protein